MIDKDVKDFVDATTAIANVRFQSKLDYLKSNGIDVIDSYNESFDTETADLLMQQLKAMFVSGYTQGILDAAKEVNNK